MIRLGRNYLWWSLVGLFLFFIVGVGPTLAGPPVNLTGYVQVWRLNIRSGPGLDYGVATVVSFNDTLELTGRTADNAWLQVRLPVTGQEGWATARYIGIGPGNINLLPIVGDSQPPSSGQATAYVIVPRLNIRGGPGLGYNVTGGLQWGDGPALAGRNADGSWLQIYVSSPYPTFAVPTGWIMARYVQSSVPIHTLPVTSGDTPPSPTEPTGRVRPPRLNLRSGPGLGYRIVGQLHAEQQVQLLGRTATGSWLKVKLSNGRSGWVLTHFIWTFASIYDLPVISDHAAATRIQFEPGSSGATLSGSLASNSIDVYVLTALAGQTMTVEVVSSDGQTLLSISGANGEVLKSSGAGSSSWSGVLPLTQDYFLAISAAGNNPVTDYTLQVTIPPR